jgi:GNAT superfamily N-acetyltransferase
MWVEPALRGTGVASRLVGMVTWWAVALGTERLVLHVTDGNRRAAAFYERQGFVATDDPHRPLRRGSSRTVGTMARSLASERAPTRVPRG